MQVLVDVPDDIAASLLPAGEDASRTLLENAAIQAYREDRVTGPELMSALGLESRFQLEEVLHRHKVWLEYTIEDLEHGRAAMEARLNCPLAQAS